MSAGKSQGVNTDEIAEILGYSVSVRGLGGDVARAWSLVDSGTSGNYVACLNPHSLVVAENDREFREALNAAELLLPDGAGIVLAGKVLGRPVAERVAGSEFFLEISRRAQDRGGVRFFFLGSTDHVLRLIRQRLEKDFPEISVTGVLSPPFRESFSEAENLAMIDAVNRSGADFLWVGMTAPKQEKWIHANRHRLQVPVIGAIGAVFDFYAGTRKRAPQWVCRLGLEWLPRFLREPRRLFRRNLVSSPVFLWMLLRERLKV